MARPTSSAAPHSAPSIDAAKALSRLKKLFDQLPEVEQQGRKSHLASFWPKEVHTVLADFYGESSPNYRNFKDINFVPRYTNADSTESYFTSYFTKGLEQAKAFLISRLEELQEEVTEASISPETFPSKGEVGRNHQKVFIVHGHDHGTKEAVARYLTKLGLSPIILHELPDEGQTIIEKFERHADVRFAVVILSADDSALLQTEPKAIEKRARQNVIFEFGYFVGRLGRDHTVALMAEGVARPSDIAGVLYIPMTDDSWRMSLLKELKAAGMEVDANKAFD